MRARTALLVVILVALAIFAALNWTVITAPTQIHLLLARVEAPLGVILLGATAGVTLLFSVFLTWTETSALLEMRRYARDLQAQRQLAEAAEASRYTELKTQLHADMASLRTLVESKSAEVSGRVHQAEEQLGGEIERANNALTAYFAELEERLNRGERPAPPGRG
jgi:uncharacterized integral membrane protein